jgi:hypothetical protein
MRELVLFLRHFLSLNPTSVAHYSSPEILVMFALAAACFVAWFLLRRWHKKQQSLTRKLSASWSIVSFWFGVVALLLIISRVERVQVMAAPFLWLFWAVGLLAYVFVQWRLFRAKHYEVLPRAATAATDPYVAAGSKRR